MKDKVRIDNFANLFKRDVKKIAEFVRKYKDFKTNCGSHVIPFYVSEDYLYLMERMKCDNPVLLIAPPANEKQGEPSRPPVIMCAKRLSGQQPETSGQADQPLQLSNYPILTSLLNGPDDQPLDLRVDSAKKSKRDIEEVSVEKTIQKRRSCQ